MAVNNKAYDISLFEVSPKVEQKQVNNVIKIPKSKLEANRRKKVNPIKAISTFLAIITFISVMLIVVHSQVELTELTEQINISSKKLQESESRYTQLQMSVESRTSLKAVEDYSKNHLGMKRIEPTQVEYISLSDSDKAEIKDTNQNKSIFNMISKIFSRS